MSFSFCLNKADVLVLCAVTLLYESMDLKNESKLLKEVQRLVNAALKILGQIQAPGTYQLERVASTLITVDEVHSPCPAQGTPESMPPPSPRDAAPALPAGRYNVGLHANASASETDLASKQEKVRRMTVPCITPARPELDRSLSRASYDSSIHEPSLLRKGQRLSISPNPSMMRVSSTGVNNPNLDYLPLSNQSAISQLRSSGQVRTPSSQPHIRSQQRSPPPLYPTPQPELKCGSGGGVSLSEWEALLGAMDGGSASVYDAIYGGGQGLSMTETPSATATTTSYTGWSPDTWDLTTFNLADIGDVHYHSVAPPSVHSLSEESASTSDDLSHGSDLYFSMTSDDFTKNGVLRPLPSSDGPLMLEGLELGLGL